MTMDQINAKLAHIDSLTAALARAWRELAASAEADGADYERIREMALRAVGHTDGQLAIYADSIRKTIVEIRRPKGPMVDLVWTDGRKDPVRVEVTRRTKQRVLVGATSTYVGTWYKLADGYTVERERHYAGTWRLSKASLEQIRAMPVGENDVSRAVKTAKKEKQ